MNFVKLFLCAFIMQFAQGLDLDLFLNLSDQTVSNVACCSNRFEEVSMERNSGQRSTIILLPDASDSVEVEEVLKRNSQRKNPGLLEVWQWKNYPKNRLFADVKTNYILFQSDEGDQMSNDVFGKITSQLPKNQTDFKESSRICIFKKYRNKDRKDSDEDCSVMNFTESSVGSNWKKGKVSLHVEGITSHPFAYFDANDGKPKGIDISLMKTLAEKLQVSTLINFIDAHHSKNALNGDSIEEYSADRYCQKLKL